jgi:hypothetical protein
MNKLEEELKQHIDLREQIGHESLVEKAQRKNTEHLTNFLWGTLIWLISFTILSLLQKSFRIIILVAIVIVDIAINSFGKIYNIEPEQLLKIRLTVIYVVVIFILMIVA